MKDSNKQTLLKKKGFIFGNIFLLANKLQVVGDQYLEKDDLTTKQWFLIVAVMQFPETPPTLSEVAELFGSSRQNVKQLAIKLEKRDFLRIEKDERDARASRLILTEKCFSFWQQREKQDNQFITDIFSPLTEEEVGTMTDCFKKILREIDKIH